jgi:hypothetical protein
MLVRQQAIIATEFILINCFFCNSFKLAAFGLLHSNKPSYLPLWSMETCCCVTFMTRGSIPGLLDDQTYLYYSRVALIRAWLCGSSSHITAV